MLHFPALQVLHVLHEFALLQVQVLPSALMVALKPMDYIAHERPVLFPSSLREAQQLLRQNTASAYQPRGGKLIITSSSPDMAVVIDSINLGMQVRLAVAQLQRGWQVVSLPL